MIEVKKQLVVNAPYQEVWRILALEFHRVGEWASVIANSQINADATAPEGADIGGRVCVVPGFGDVKESFTAYDEDNLTFSYEATSGMPFFVKTAGNTWSLTPQGDKTVVDMHLMAETNLFPGALMAPLMKGQFDRQGWETIDDLKYYVENGKPSPRKQDAMKKVA